MKKIIDYLKQSSLTKKIGLGIALISLILFLRILIKNIASKSRAAKLEYPFASMLYPSQVIRVDSSGSGYFGASRSGGTRSHDGIDLVTYRGQVIYAPFDGKVTREFFAYSNDSKYKGVEMISTNGVFKIKIMYCTPKSDKIGFVVKQGDMIAFSQSISEKYVSPMTDHLHIELYENNERIDPLKHIQVQ